MRLNKVCIAILLLMPVRILAEADPNPSSWFRDISISSGHKVNSATCFLCSVHVDGEVAEDVTTQWGDIENRGLIGGDAVAVAGSIHLYPDARVLGDCVSVFGDTAIDERAQVRNDTVASWGAVRRSPAAPPGNSETATGPSFLSKTPARFRATLLLWCMGIFVSVPLAFISYGLVGKERLETMINVFRSHRGETLLCGILIFGLIAGAMSVAGDSAKVDVIEPTLTGLLLLLLAPGYTALSLRVGRRFAAGPKLALLLGVFMLITLQAIPILGWMMSCVLAMISFGMPWVGIWAAYQH